MRRLLFIMLLAVMIPAGCASVKPISYEKRLLVAIGDLQNQTGNPEYNESMDGLTGILLDEMQETECFRLIERQRLKAMLEEMQLGMTGLLDPDKTKEVGQLLGVDAILFVNLASVRHTSDVNNAFIAKSEKEKIEVKLDARLVAVNTGEILATARNTQMYTKHIGTAFGFITSGNKADVKAIVHASLEAALKEIASQIASNISRRRI